jgi:hypothetical protein
MRLLRPLEAQGQIRWLNRDLAIGRPADSHGWQTLRARGVGAVVDVSREAGGAAGGLVREQGMRYLRLSVNRSGLPEAEELHIVTAWVLERIRDSGSVLVHDSDGRGNDALIACAVMVKDGLSAEKAQSYLLGISNAALEAPQVELLHRFVAQRAIAAGGR